MISDLQSELSQLRRDQRERLGMRSSGNGVGAIYQALFRIVSDHPEIDLLELGNGPELVHLIEREIHPSRHFSRPDEFELAARQAIHAVGMLRSVERQTSHAKTVRKNRQFRRKIQ
jgi:hypothetical protein